MLFLVVFATAMLFALSCHSYRLEVLVGRRRERALSRTALRALRVIAFTTAIVLGIVVADHAFGISRWSEEILAVTKGWVVVAWLVAIAVQRPRVSSRP